MRLCVSALVGLCLAASLTACGGGGGSSGGPTPVTPVPTGTPATQPSPTPTPTATPGLTTLQYTGRVVDADHGNTAVAGATVAVGTSFVYGGAGYVLGGITATTTTLADGSFAIAGVNAPTFVQVTASGLVPAHRPLPIAPATTLGTIALPTASNDELAGLAELNVNRAQYGMAQGAQPLSLDADLALAARAHAIDEATLGYYGHTSPGTAYAFSPHYISTLGGFSANPYFIQENLAAGPGGVGSLALADDAYISAGPGEGHHDNVVSKTNLWVGLGEALRGKHDSGSPQYATEDYFVEDYTTQTANPSP